MRDLSNRLKAFCSDENGALIAEAVIVIPLFIWAYLGLYVYWDAYRSLNAVQKSTYTISDMITREMNPVTEAYIGGMQQVMEYMLDADQTMVLRVTSITRDEANQRFNVDWSRSPNGGMSRLTNSTVEALEPKIPDMADGDSALIVEAEVSHDPAFEMGLSDQTFKQFIVTRPRFVPRICLEGVVCG